jgi:phage gp36-like protein
MSYATAADLQARYPQTRLAELSDPDGQAIQEPKLLTALADASAEMDSHLGRRYTLPLSQVPPVLQRMACDIAIYRLMSLLPKETVADARRRYDDAIEWLGDLVDGRIKLADLSGQELTGGPSVRIASSSAPRVFGNDTLGSFR